MTAHPTALILDFGGVLTNDFWETLRDFARQEGLPENAVIAMLTRDPEGAELFRDLERGAIDQAGFEARMGPLLGVPSEGLLRRMAGDLRPDEEMLAFVADLRARGVTLAILSNSCGGGYFDPYEPWNLADRAEIVVLSHEVRLRKPDPAIFELVLNRLGLPGGECVFVDDIAPYLEPAKALGMRVLHHTRTTETIGELRRIFAPRYHA